MYILLYIARYCPADLRALAPRRACCCCPAGLRALALVVPAAVALQTFEPSPSSCLLLLPCRPSSPRPRRACCCCPSDLQALAPRCPCCHVYNTRHRPDTTPGVPGAYYQPARQRGGRGKGFSAAGALA